jgi:DnaK suppressor protein
MPQLDAHVVMKTHHRELTRIKAPSPEAGQNRFKSSFKPRRAHPEQGEWAEHPGATMSQAPTAAYTQQLQQMRTDLIARIRAQRGGKIGRAEAAGDPHDIQSGDWAQADAERDLAQAFDERETAELTAIDAALKRIEAGDYGQCGDCGIDIPAARLQANPTALRCVGCQEKAEHAKGGVAQPSL